MLHLCLRTGLPLESVSLSLGTAALGCGFWLCSCSSSRAGSLTRSTRPEGPQEAEPSGVSPGGEDERVSSEPQRGGISWSSIDERRAGAVPLGLEIQNGISQTQGSRHWALLLATLRVWIYGSGGVKTRCFTAQLPQAVSRLLP